MKRQDDVKLYTGYVYMIYNNVNGKVYIGETIQTIQKRFKQHINESSNVNSSTYNYLISRAIRKYGYSNFFVKELDRVVGEDKKQVKKEIL